MTLNATVDATVTLSGHDTMFHCTSYCMYNCTTVGITVTLYATVGKHSGHNTMATIGTTVTMCAPLGTTVTLCSTVGTVGP